MGDVNVKCLKCEVGTELACRNSIIKPTRFTNFSNLFLK